MMVVSAQYICFSDALKNYLFPNGELRRKQPINKRRAHEN